MFLWILFRPELRSVLVMVNSQDQSSAWTDVSKWSAGDWLRKTGDRCALRRMPVCQPNVGFDDVAVEPFKRGVGRAGLTVMSREEGKESRIGMHKIQPRRLRKMGCRSAVVEPVDTRLERPPPNAFGRPRASPA